ncbi:hypothetical protein [Streptomyces sp. NBC_00690]|uniref:hypothetical protein n=1 Tax=Streptomyces sp. NBC_00690 TaxID=2975808 RepID=UPI002E2C8387|nr:hypothetical protein [Streptomyces sp. NBC_00690]
MITARPPIGVLRPANFRGPLHFLWLTLLVLGLLSTHGTNAEGVTHHPASTAFSTVNSVPLPVVIPTSNSSGGTTSHELTADAGPPTVGSHGARPSNEVHTGSSAHHVEQCMPTQPQLTPSSPMPCPAALTQCPHSDWSPPAPSLDGSSGAAAIPGDAQAHDVLRI